MAETCKCGKKLTKNDTDGMCKRCRNEKNNKAKNIAFGALGLLATVATAARFIIFKK